MKINTIKMTSRESEKKLGYIKELFGNKGSKTTEIYTYVSEISIGKIVSPLGRLKEKGYD